MAKGRPTEVEERLGVGRQVDTRRPERVSGRLVAVSGDEAESQGDDNNCIAHNIRGSALVEGCGQRRAGTGADEGFFYCQGPAHEGDFNKCPQVRKVGGYERILPPRTAK